MRRNLLLLLLAFAAALPLCAQKELKPLRELVKTGKNADALKEAARLAADSTWSSQPQVYALQFQAYRQQYDQQNEKMYLQQQADTSLYFQAVRGMFLAAQSHSTALLHKKKSGKADLRGRSTQAQQLRLLIPNLQAAAAHHYTHAQYAEAEEAARLLLTSTADSTLWDGEKPPTLSPFQQQVASLICLQGNYQMKRYAAMLPYSRLALRYQPARAEVMEELAVAHLALGDTATAFNTLRSAFKSYPTRQSIYDRLSLRYKEQHQYDSLLGIAQTLIAADTARIDGRQDEILALHHLQRPDSVIRAARALIALQPDNAIGHYYLGMAYITKAQAVPVPVKRSGTKNYRTLIKERRSWYSKARRPMEEYRKLRPVSVKSWAQPLYLIYLNLNLGKEFEEISRLME